MSDTSLSFREQLLTGLRKAATTPNIHGYKPHEQQERFHKSTKTGRLFIGGNRSGKTVGGAAETVWRLRGSHPYQRVPESPIRARGSAVDITQGLNKIMLPEIARWLPPSDLINGSWEDSYHRQDRVLTLKNGSTMDFLTYEMGIEKHAGTSRHWQWFDEEPPEYIYNEDLLRLVDVNGKFAMTMTPTEGMTWVYYNIVRPVVEEQDSTVADNIEVIIVSTLENPHVDRAVLDAMTQGMPEEEKLARRHGTFMAASGLIYPGFKDDVHVIDPVDLTKLKGRMIISGMDHGLRNPTAWLWVTVDHEGRIILVHEYCRAERTIREHAEYVKNFEALNGIEVAYRIGDPAIDQRSGITGGSVRSEYAEHGVYIGLGNNDVGYGVNRVRQYIDNSGLFICRNNPQIIKDLRNYRWDVWATRKQAASKEAKDKPKKKDDHTLDALRYIVASRPEDEFAGAAGHVYMPFAGATPTTPVNPFEARESDWDFQPERNHQILGDDY